MYIHISTFCTNTIYKTIDFYFIAKNVQSELVFSAFNLNKVEHKGDILQ